MENPLSFPKPGALARTTTWLDQIPTPPIILEFVRRYPYDHYLTLAERAKDLISKELKVLKDSNGQGVQAKVTCRAKMRHGLEEKLKMRNDTRPKQYAKIEEIQDDIHDLAGVRILLYTPSADEYVKVEEMIQAIWGPKVKRKPHGGFIAPPPNSALAKAEQDWTELGNFHSSRTRNKYVPRHAGYQAIHYRTPMNKEEEEQVHTGRGPYGWMEDDRVEIQVVSAFGHAWAEAEHNVKYKSYAYGRPSKQEERILDSLSGLVSSGDLLLEQFREIFDKRTYKKILYRDEFGTFLRDLDILEVPELEEEDKQQDSGYQDHFGREGVDILFRFLVERGQNYPLAVRNALKKLGYPENPEATLSEILDTFDPAPTPPKGRLAPLCLIHHLLIEDRQEVQEGEVQEPTEDVGPVKQCYIMVNALTHLQTFAGGSEPAKRFLEADATMTERERDSLEFMLSSPRRELCLTEADAKIDEIVRPDLQPAWAWFQTQATLANPYSFYGLLFKLVIMGITKEADVETLLRELTIGRLSRNNTWGSDDGLDW
jgi:ppGpp synthetase/RelA/SpoT-type nucleotidyltranferase